MLSSYFRLGIAIFIILLWPSLSAVLPSLKNAQTFDFSALLLCHQEISRICIPSKVEMIAQEDEYNMGIKLKTKSSESMWLHICWHPQYARVCIGPPPQRTESNSYSFATILRSALRDTYLTHLSLPKDFERTVEFKFSESVHDESVKWILYQEILGAKSNLIFTSLDSTIQACAFQVSSTKNRPLQTGAKYVPRFSTSGGAFSPLSFIPAEGPESLDSFENFCNVLQVLFSKNMTLLISFVFPSLFFI